MPVYKDDKSGTWYVMTRYEDWKGEKKQKCKRGFSTRKEAQEWERSFQQQNSGDLDMTFADFIEVYEKDIRPRLKENTWLSKEHIIRTKLLPYFGKRIISEIGTKDVIAWQNELLAYRDEKRKEKLTEKQPHTLRQMLSDYYQGRNAGTWSRKGKISNAKQFADALLYLSQHDIETLEDLEARLGSISSQAGSLKDRISAAAQRVSDLDEMIRLGETFLRTKPIVEELNGIHWKGRREKYEAAHEADLRAFQTARRVLKERYGITVAKGITIQGWKKEHAQLKRDQEKMYEQYAPLQDELGRLLMVKHCAEIVMRGEQRRGHEQPMQLLP